MPSIVTADAIGCEKLITTLQNTRGCIIWLTMAEQFAPQNPNQFNVVTWNILLDRSHGELVTQQHERIESQAKKLLELGMNLDVVGICEAEGRNGQLIAEMTGNSEGFWYPHSRRDEHIGVFGSLVERSKPVYLGHKKTAVVTEVMGGVAVAQIHLKRQNRGPERSEQMAVLLDRLKGYDQAVIMGDTNCLPWQRPLRMMEEAGFVSVFEALGHRALPRTVPTPEYRKMLKMSHRLLVGKGLAVDGIYVKNLDVINAGTAVGDSDHALVGATLAA